MEREREMELKKVLSMQTTWESTGKNNEKPRGEADNDKDKIVRTKIEGGAINKEQDKSEGQIYQANAEGRAKIRA